MIGPTGAVRVMVATKPVDFRKGAEGLAALVRETMQADPFDGAIYVFRAKRADRIKLVFWDGTGVCLFAKRLEDGEFRWPKIEDGVMCLSTAQFSALLEGLDWKRVRAKETPAPGVSEILCGGRVDHHAVTNLSSNMMANWVLASHHSRGGIFHSPATWRKTRYSSFIAASSVGKCPRVRTARRSFAFKDSMAFVV